MSDVKPGSYNAVSIGLHWATVLLFVAAYSTIELRELFPKIPRGSSSTAIMEA